jgi:hypothetical protein
LNPSSTNESLEELKPKARTTTQPGDLTGRLGDKFSAGETVAELIEEGQDLEGELVHALGTSREADGGQLSVRRIPLERIPDYKNRNRL